MRSNPELTFVKCESCPSEAISPDTRHRKLCQAHWRSYLERDCVLLQSCLDKFYSMVGLAGGEVALTAPGTAMASFRRVHLNETVPTNRHYPTCKHEETPDCEGCLHSFVRRGYYGGRVEVYRDKFLGPGSLNVGDINSMYPWAMLGPVPTELVAIKEGSIDFEKHCAHWLGFLDVDIDVPRGAYLPPLPYRTQDKLVFPTGTLSGVWTSEEIRNAIVHGCTIRRMGRSVWFRGKPIFTEFVKHWYSYRDKSSPNYSEAMAHVAKLLLNSLYGKMGTNEERDKLWFYPRESDFADHELTAIANAVDGVYTEKVRISSSYIIPHIAAWITSVARVRLHNIAQSFIDSGYEIYYMDTDCCHTTAPLSSSTRLGELKLECSVLYAEYAAPKLYLMRVADGHSEVKAKGFSGGFGAGKMTEEMYRQIVSHKAKVKIQKMTKLREGLRGGARFPSMKTVMKGLTQLDTKRVHLPDGNTEAIHIETTF